MRTIDTKPQGYSYLSEKVVPWSQREFAHHFPEDALGEASESFRLAISLRVGYTGKPVFDLQLWQKLSKIPLEFPTMVGADFQGWPIPTNDLG